MGMKNISDDLTREPEGCGRGTAVGDASSLKIWDTQYCLPKEAFAIFREGICATFMPWSPEHRREDAFKARIESLLFERGAAAHTALTPVVAPRTAANIARSHAHGFYGSYVLCGEMQVEQAGRVNVGKPGDLIIYDTTLPVTLTQRAPRTYEDFAFFIPRDCLSIAGDHELNFRNVLLSRERMLRPFSHCLTHLAGSVPKGSREELQALFEACAALLPVALGCYDARESDERHNAPSSELLREVLEFINRNISDVDLSPGKAARHFGVSPRYIHKLFARTASTFGSYVLSKRLDHIRRDLLLPAYRHLTISRLAYRWGFNDLSNFNRAFKTRFGCSPSQCRGT
jgi:AraC family transcriptional regulator, positive regulator of tynA and feaB